MNPSADRRSDQELVAAINAGDLSAFDALYDRHRDWVARLAMRFTGNSSDALDVLQETFTYLFGKFPGFLLSAKMTTFLYPVVRNLSIAARKRRLPGLPAEGFDAPASGVASNDSDEFLSMIRRLPEIQREVLLMRFVHDMSLAEIAEALGIPEGTVKSRMHNAIQTLKGEERLRKYFD